MPLVDLVSPPLTTVRIEHRDMGRGAAKLLLKEIEMRAVTAEHLILQPKLIVRGSTMAASIVTREQAGLT
jgi:LacI family transcriptional regulator